MTRIVAAIALLLALAPVAQGAAVRVAGAPEVGVTLRATDASGKLVRSTWQVVRGATAQVVARGTTLRLRASYLGGKVRAVPGVRSLRASALLTVRPGIDGTAAVDSRVTTAPAAARTTWQVLRKPDQVLVSSTTRDGTLQLQRPIRRGQNGIVAAIILPKVVRSGTWTITATSPRLPSVTGRVTATCTSACRWTIAGVRSVSTQGPSTTSLGARSVLIPGRSGAIYRVRISGSVQGLAPPGPARQSVRWRPGPQLARTGAPLTTQWVTVRTASSLTIPTAEAGYTMRARVPYRGRSYVTANRVIPIAVAALPRTVGPMIVGATISATRGAWYAPAATTYTQAWQRTQGAGWAPVGDTDLALNITSSLVGERLRLCVTARYSAQSLVACSAPTDVVAPRPVPALQAAPQITGEGVEGQVLGVSTGAWANCADCTYGYAWQRSGSATGPFAPIAGASGPTYGLEADDVGTYLMVAVTATNADGATVANTAVAGPIQSLAPVVRTEPQITGVAQAGHVLVGDGGAWWGSPPPTVTLAWQAASDGTTWTAAPGALGAPEYDLPIAAVGEMIRLCATASNGNGSATSCSAPVGPVAAPNAPENLDAPSITGVAQVGYPLTADDGRWAGLDETISRVWLRCDAQGASCASTGLSGATLTPTADDIGVTWRILVTATSPYGTTQSTSDATGATLPPAPVSTAPPEVAGIAEANEEVTTGTGSWDWSPSGYAYQWQASPDGATWGPAPGGTAATYLIPVSVVGQYLRACVTASNAGGATQACSAATVAVIPPVPNPLGPPSLAVRNPAWASAQTAPMVDGNIDIDLGEWSETPIQYQVVWQSTADPVTDPWDTFETDLVPGPTQTATLVVPASELGLYIRARVRANDGGLWSQWQESDPTTQAVVQTAPQIQGAPQISGLTAGEPRLGGGALSASSGTWSGSPTSYTYQWQANNGSWYDIGGATDPSYQPSPSVWHQALRVCVVAANADWTSTDTGAGPACSAPTGITKWNPPVYQGGLGATGGMTVGDVKTAQPGTWSNNPQSYSYYWYSTPGYWSSGDQTITLPRPSDIGVTVCATAVGPDYAGAQACVGLGTVAARTWTVQLNPAGATLANFITPSACQWTGAKPQAGSGCVWTVGVGAGEVITAVNAPSVSRQWNWSTGAKELVACVGGACSSGFTDGNMPVAPGVTGAGINGWATDASITLRQAYVPGGSGYSSSQIIYLAFNGGMPYATVRDAPG